MSFDIKMFSDNFIGNMSLVFGVILLLHTLGVLEKWLGYILIILSIYMIIFGFIKADYHTKIMGLFKKRE